MPSSSNNLTKRIQQQKLKAVFFSTELGVEPVRDWLLSLPKEECKVIGTDISTVQFGWPLGMPLVRKIEPDLWEVRVKLDNKIARVLFTVINEVMVLLHGFIKKSQKIPQDDLKLAQKRKKQVQTGV